MSKIKKIHSRQIIDSRGNPTVEVDVIQESGEFARAAVPSGASTGKFEAIELRDKEQEFMGKCVSVAVNNINTKINSILSGTDVSDQTLIDQKMIDEDGTENKSVLGANAILGVSIACLKAASKRNNKQLYEYIAGNQQEYIMPVPMMNILNGGSHADNNIDIQEFMIFPTGLKSFSHGTQACIEIYHCLQSILKSKKLSTSVGDEGGFAPNLGSNEEALELIVEAISTAGYKAGEEINLTLDVAASEFYDENEKVYRLTSDDAALDTKDLIKYYQMLSRKYPIVSIEDGLDENDWDGWSQLNSILGNEIQIVGDDLTVTNPQKLEKAIRMNSINSILIKLNQIGTVTETLKTIKMAHKNNITTIISHRSGETEDVTIADLAVGSKSGQIKSGAPCRTDRPAKYNQLLRIEEMTANNNRYFNFNEK